MSYKISLKIPAMLPKEFEALKKEIESVVFKHTGCKPEYSSQPSLLLSDKEIEKKAEEVLANHVVEDGLSKSNYSIFNEDNLKKILAAMVEIYKSALSTLSGINDREVYVVVSVEDEPTEEGAYFVKIGGWWVNVLWCKEYGFHEEFTDCSGVTHWLKLTTIGELNQNK